MHVRKKPNLSKENKISWTKEDDTELYRCYCITQLNKLPIQDELFKLWSQRNPTLRPTLTTSTLRSRAYKVVHILTNTEKIQNL